jgi:DNA polymerase sigma
LNDVEINAAKTSLLRTYCEQDPRAGPFLQLVKCWAKHRQVCDASMGFLNSFGWCLLAINFLQMIGILPCLQYQQSGVAPFLEVPYRLESQDFVLAESTAASFLQLSLSERARLTTPSAEQQQVLSVSE